MGSNRSTDNMFSIVILVCVLFTFLIAGTVFFIDYKNNQILWKKMEGLEDRKIEIVDQYVTFRGGNIGVISLLIEVEDAKSNIGDSDFIFKDHLIYVSSDIENYSVNKLLPIYKKELVSIGKSYGIKVKEVYISKFVVQ